MICSECNKKGMKSKVFLNLGAVTCMPIHSYYDEEGNYHYHNGNGQPIRYHCTNGHIWHELKFKECPTCGLSWRSNNKLVDIENILQCSYCKRDFVTSGQMDDVLCPICLDCGWRYDKENDWVIYPATPD